MNLKLFSIHKPKIEEGFNSTNWFRGRLPRFMDSDFVCSIPFSLQLELSFHKTCLTCKNHLSLPLADQVPEASSSY